MMIKQMNITTDLEHILMQNMYIFAMVNSAVSLFLKLLYNTASSKIAKD